ncbi:MAG: hypothetical protein LC808_14080 [Actinobacteria bacterium]|nr:hypothetical protein [Actinomycetota bacterium]
MALDDDGDPGEAFDRAAARASRRDEARTSAGFGFQWINERRFRGSVTRLIFVVFLLAAHIVAVRAVTGWLIAHLVVIAVLASQVAKRWLARNDARPLPHEL